MDSSWWMDITREQFAIETSRAKGTRFELNKGDKKDRMYVHKPPVEGKSRAAEAKARQNPNSIGVANGEKTHCAQGHKFTPANTRRRKTDGARICKACCRGYGQKYRDSNKVGKRAAA